MKMAHIQPDFSYLKVDGGRISLASKRSNLLPSISLLDQLTLGELSVWSHVMEVIPLYVVLNSHGLQ